MNSLCLLNTIVYDYFYIMKDSDLKGIMSKLFGLGVSRILPVTWCEQAAILWSHFVCKLPYVWKVTYNEVEKLEFQVLKLSSRYKILLLNNPGYILDDKGFPY